MHISSNPFYLLRYFKPKTGKITVRKWTDKEKDLLIQGIEKHGIGSWAKIQEEFLTLWVGQGSSTWIIFNINNYLLQELSELRVKTARLMGRQSLVQYIEDGWKGNADDVAREYENNKRIGLELNCWKGGVLVNDAAGEVLKILAAEGRGAKVAANGTSTTKKGAADKKRSPKQDDEEEADAAGGEGEEEEEYQPAPTKRKRNK